MAQDGVAHDLGLGLAQLGAEVALVGVAVLSHAILFTIV